MSELQIDAQDDNYQTILLEQDHCPILEAFLEDAGKDLVWPMTSKIFTPNPFFTSLARTKAVVDLTINELLSIEARNAGLHDDAKILEEFPSVSDEGNMQKFKDVYEELLKKVQEIRFRRMRVCCSRTAVILMSFGRIPGHLAVRSLEQHQNLATEVGNIAMHFASFATVASAEKRQEMLHRILVTQVVVVRNQDPSKVC